MIKAYILCAIFFCAMVILIVLNMLESKKEEEKDGTLDDNRLKNLVEVLKDSKK